MLHCNLTKNDDVFVINKTGRILFKTQRSFSVPTAKETKSNEEAEPKVFFIHCMCNFHKHFNLLMFKRIQIISIQIYK